MPLKFQARNLAVTYIAPYLSLSTLLWMACCLVVGLSVYVHVLVLFNAGPLWRDEVNTVVLASRPFWQSVHDTLYFDTPPLMVVVVKIFHVWFDTDFGYRVLGFGIGLGLLATIVVSARMLSGFVPLYTLGCIGLSEAFVRYGDSVRPYGLGSIAVLLLAAFVWKYVTDKDAGWKVFAGASALAVMAVQALYINSFLVLALCVGGAAVGAARGAWRTAIGVLGIGACAALSLVPYRGGILFTASWFQEGETYVPSTVWHAFLSALGSIGYVLLSTLLLMLVSAYAWFLFVRRKKAEHITEQQRSIRTFVIVTLCVACIGFLSFLILGKLYARPWYLMPFTALVVLLVELLLVTFLAPRVVYALFGIVCLGGVLFVYPSSVDQAKLNASNVDDVAVYLQRMEEKGDLVLIYPWFLGVGFNYYYKGTSDWMSVPTISDLSIHRYDLAKVSYDREQLSYEETKDAVSRALQSGNTVWLVSSGPWCQGPKEICMYLLAHTVEQKFVFSLSDQPAVAYENMSLVRLKGWKP